MAASTTAINADSGSQANAYFETGPNQILCKVPGLDQPSFPEEFEHSWDLKHVRLPCSDRVHKNEDSLWPQIVRGLSETILNSQQLSQVMLGWNKSKEHLWNINALEAFLNYHSREESALHVDGTLSDGVLEESDRLAQAALDSDDDYGSIYNNSDSEPEHEQEHNQQQQQQQQQGHGDQDLDASAQSGGPLRSQLFSTLERQHFFEVTLPRMQALALRLPELVPKKIPFLTMQNDSAITLSQEQIACLLANAFFNTFPSRNAPFKRGRKKKPAFARAASGGDVSQQQQNEDDEDDDDEDQSEDEKAKGKQASRGGKKAGRGGSNGGAASARGGRGGHAQGRGGKKALLTAPRKPRKLRSSGPAAQFEFFENAPGTASPAVDQRLSASVKYLSVKELDQDHDQAKEAEKVQEEKDYVPKMPSINFISMFWSEDSLLPCSSSQAAKLRCILHYFDRVTTEMPQGTVTYHRQVLKKPAYLKPGERLSSLDFVLSKVTLDASTPIEDAPEGALQLDFANKNIGGGVLDKGAVQEEIRFVICPELLIARLFTQQLEANEAILIKGAERYSNYIGYSKTFEWYSDHKDLTPRDKLGRRMTEICAIDARPFKSRISRLEQFEKHYLLREINKALVGYRISPINSSEWGMAKASDEDRMKDWDAVNRYRPIATGNWGCGAFGGHLQLKFVLQWIAASICGGFDPQSKRLGQDVLYYTFGMQSLADEIEEFVKVIQAADKVVEPKRLVECILQYPRRNPAGEIQGFREKTLLEYLSSAITFVA
ncbi:hypothetical protein BGZ70_006466 [Mortierella alpina]|uniref:poly(ADP-ribose) glycohydrolase n=1 Tax=Mortierella alpina TaxID=64518 RepID=A0A9P6J9Y9_MORAP|nr:hypothetical protein BGZ70_006466 [Mortierella alpina]